MKLRTVRLLDALNTAAHVYAQHQVVDGTDFDGGLFLALTDYVSTAYGLDASAQPVVRDVVKGTVSPLRAVKAIKAIAEMYEEDL
jgi:hypothetical protein